MAQRLVDRENRRFNPEWTVNFFFHEVQGKPICLICNNSVAVNKAANLKRHYTRSHPDYDGRYPHGTARRTEQLNRLKRQATGQMAMMRGATSLQKRAATAGYEVCYRIAKAMAPYKHSELIKDCMVSTLQVLYPDKQEIHQAIQSIPMSRNTCTRRVEALGNHLTNAVADDLKNCESFSVAVDESTDINDVAQLSVFVRYYLNNVFNERLLIVIPMKERTTGEAIYKAFKEYMDSKDIPLHKITSVATDGAPAMVGVHAGFVKRLKDHSPQLLAFHCIIHESVLCSQLKDEYGSLMLNIMKLINFLRSKSALRHRQLRKFLQDSHSEHDDLLVHNNVRLVYQSTVIPEFQVLTNNFSGIRLLKFTNSLNV